MANLTLDTLPRDAKGPLAPPPVLDGMIKVIAEAIAQWRDVDATTHWRFDAPDRVDGVDFYVGSNELGHIHLDGSIHLATTSPLCAELVAEGLGQPFAWGRGWTVAHVNRLGVEKSVGLFRRNYDRLTEVPPRRIRGS